MVVAWVDVVPSVVVWLTVAVIVSSVVDSVLSLTEVVTAKGT